MIGEAWWADPERLWTRRVRNLHVGSPKIFEDGIEIERSGDVGFQVKENGQLVYKATHGRKSFDRAVRECVNYLLSRKDAEMALSEKGQEALRVLAEGAQDLRGTEYGGHVAALMQYGLVERQGDVYALTAAGRERIGAVNGNGKHADVETAQALGEPSEVVEAARRALAAEAAEATARTSCDGCINKRVLEMLMREIPNAREIYDLMVALDEKLARLRRK